MSTTKHADETETSESGGKAPKQKIVEGLVAAMEATWDEDHEKFEDGVAQAVGNKRRIDIEWSDSE